MEKVKSLTRGILALIVCFSLNLMLLPGTVFAGDDDTFTVTYKTNTGCEMGILEYTVGGVYSLPATNELSTKFNAFIQKLAQNGSIYVPHGNIWFEDAEFTTPAIFPQGEAGKNYTVYCQFTVGGFSMSGVENTAENVSYADVGSNRSWPHLGVSSYSITGRNDGYRNTKAIFERQNDQGDWEEVPADMYKDAGHNTWPNLIFFNSVSDSGLYRLKTLRYTATDVTGAELFFVDAEGVPADVYTVSITPVELSITGVAAEDRDCDGTNEVELSGGSLEGILFGDDVSFSLGKGTVENTEVGSGKPVTTNITLTGGAAENYVLVQPEGLTVTISHYQDTEVRNAEAATCTSKGYTGDTVCPGCGTVLQAGTVLEMIPHHYVNGVCTVCNAEEPPSYIPPVPTEEDEIETPSAEDPVFDVVPMDGFAVDTLGDTYYFSGGRMVTGWVEDAETGEWYYMRPQNGKMVRTDWEEVDGIWYYFFDDGVMATGWQFLDGHWYYFYRWGGMAKGWLLDMDGWAQTVGGVWYYLDPVTGQMADNGWKLLDDGWYYLYRWGGMAKGWVWWNGDWYYVRPNWGNMVANATVENYQLGADGAMQ